MNNNILKGLNLIVFKTSEIFDNFNISTKKINFSLRYSVIDLDKNEITYSFKTKKDALLYLSELTNRVVVHRKIENEILH